jgi:hypothetical protein
MAEMTISPPFLPVRLASARPGEKHTINDHLAANIQDFRRISGGYEMIIPPRADHMGAR